MLKQVTGIIFAVACISIVYTQESDSNEDYDAPSYQRQGGHYKYGESYRVGPRYRNRYQPYQTQHQDYEEFDGYDHDYYDYGYKKIVCPQLDNPANGRVRQKGVHPGSKAFYFCKKGFTVAGDRVRVCQRNGKFSGEAATCEPVDCGDPPAPDNGAVSYDDATFGNQATQSCNSGYELQGVEVRTCQADGQWSDEVAMCTPVDCGEPPAPNNGAVSFDDTTLGNQATQSCNPGFERQGVEIRTCQDNGQWSNEVAMCTPVDCGDPPAPDNGAVSFDDTTLGNQATQSCNPGYELQGVEVRTCQADGQWSDEVAVCTPVDCGDPPAPNNGTVSFTETTLGNQATQSCNPGFERLGVEIRTCQDDEEWSDQVAVCTPVDCGPLDDPDNGKVSFSSTTYLSVARYTCDEGFIRVGTAVRGCQANGQWSSQAPTCIPVDCGQPESPDQNGDVSVDETTLGNTATYSCDAGYDLVGSDTVTCLSTGQWSDGAPTCQPVDCGQPDDPDENGSVDVGSTTFQSTATYSCDEGYILTGSETVKCQADRTWSDTAPICHPVDCGQPESPDQNGDVSVDETTLGNTATYSCDAGYDLFGSATVTCLSTGQWSDGAPACQPVNCGQPDDPDENGSVDVGSTTFESIATYSCDEGYILTGSETVECQADRTWSDSAPECVPVDCGPLSDPDNGAVGTDPDTTLNSVATYRCKRGFKLVGDKQRTCETSGEWSGEAPTCQKIRCPKLKPPQYGKIYISGYYPGDHVIYRCAYGYNVHGGKHRRVCQYSGVWSGKDVECKKRAPHFDNKYHGDRYYDDQY